MYPSEETSPLFSLALVNVSRTNRGAAVISQSDSHRFTIQYLCSRAVIARILGEIYPFEVDSTNERRYSADLSASINFADTGGDLQPTNFGLLTRTGLSINNIIFKCSPAHVSLSLVHYSTIFRRQQSRPAMNPEPCVHKLRYLCKLMVNRIVIPSSTLFSRFRKFIKNY